MFLHKSTAEHFRWPRPDDLGSRSLPRWRLEGPLQKTERRRTSFRGDLTRWWQCQMIKTFRATNGKTVFFDCVSRFLGSFSYKWHYAFDHCYKMFCLVHTNTLFSRAFPPSNLVFASQDICMLHPHQSSRICTSHRCYDVSLSTYESFIRMSSWRYY